MGSGVPPGGGEEGCITFRLGILGHGMVSVEQKSMPFQSVSVGAGSHSPQTAAASPAIDCIAPSYSLFGGSPADSPLRIQRRGAQTSLRYSSPPTSSTPAPPLIHTRIHTHSHSLTHSLTRPCQMRCKKTMRCLAKDAFRFPAG